MLKLLKASVYSIYMDNISQDVIVAQKKCVDRFLPDGWEFIQFYNNQNYSHPEALSKCVSGNKNPLTVFLDIDCIPLTSQGFELLADRASKGILIGAVQRANHLNNNAHLYVGPFCMAFSTERYQQLGSPSFQETAMGDVGEEITYAWQDHRWPVCFFWPSSTQEPLWDLQEGKKFGLGTTYSNLFYHHFCIRDGLHQESFVAKCKQFLESFELEEMRKS